MSPCRTRSSNSSKHPGVIVQTKSRRSSAEVKAEAEAKKAAKAAKKEQRNTGIRKVTEFEREAMVQEDLTDATPQPPKLASKHGSTDPLDMEDPVSDSMENPTPRPYFISECTTGHDSDSDAVDEPNVNHNMYLPPHESSDELDNLADAETVDSTPVPASKRKKNTSLVTATKQMKLNEAVNPKSKVKKLANIAEDPESKEESVVSKKGWGSRQKGALVVEDAESKEAPLVSKKGRGSRKKGTLVVEDSEPSNMDLPLPPPTKKPKVSAEEKPEVKSTQWGKKEGICEAISAINEGKKVEAAAADVKCHGGTGEVVTKGKNRAVTEQVAM